MRWRAGLRREGLFHIKAETQTAFVMARQFRNHADHLDVAPLPFIRQAHGKALFGLPCGVIETQPTGESGEQQEADGTNEKVFAGQQRRVKREGINQQQPRPRKIRQRGLLL